MALPRSSSLGDASATVSVAGAAALEPPTRIERVFRAIGGALEHHQMRVAGRRHLAKKYKTSAFFDLCRVFV